MQFAAPIEVSTRRARETKPVLPGFRVAALTMLLFGGSNFGNFRVWSFGEGGPRKTGCFFKKITQTRVSCISICSIKGAVSPIFSVTTNSQKKLVCFDGIVKIMVEIC